MPQDKRPEEDSRPRQSYMPRPPSQADIDLVSEQQGMVEDEWTGEPAPPHQQEPAKPDPGRTPG